MSGYIIEYVTNGWMEFVLQPGVKEPHLDDTKEVLSLWEYENEEEATKIVHDLRKFRLDQRNGK